MTRSDMLSIGRFALVLALMLTSIVFLLLGDYWRFIWLSIVWFTIQWRAWHPPTEDAAMTPKR